MESFNCDRMNIVLKYIEEENRNKVHKIKIGAK